MPGAPLAEEDALAPVAPATSPRSSVSRALAARARLVGQLRRRCRSRSPRVPARGDRSRRRAAQARRPRRRSAASATSRNASRERGVVGRARPRTLRAAGPSAVVRAARRARSPWSTLGTSTPAKDTGFDPVATVSSRYVLLEHGVEVGAAEAEGAHAGPADARRRHVPLPQLGVDREGHTAEVDVGVGAVEVDARRQHLLVERHRPP